MCDKLIMTEGSGLYLAGPALVKSAIGQDVGHEELGGAKMHAAISGTIDFREPDDDACLARVRALAGHAAGRSRKPRSFVAVVAGRPGPLARRDLPHRLARTRRRSYEVRDLLDCLVDADTFQEYKAEYGRTVICGYARIGRL